MSYFEELWSAGREENVDFSQDSEHDPDIFTMFNEVPSKQESEPVKQEEIFFSPSVIADIPTPPITHIPTPPVIKPIVQEEDTFGGLSIGGKLKVLGVGGAGCNAINRMMEDSVAGVEFLAINTDVQVLKKSLTPNRIAIGAKITKGLGAGAKPEIGEKAAIESAEEIGQQLKDTDMVFITAGMGGGTGTGAAPIIAQVAKEAGCLVVAVVTLPFSFEGTKRQKTALEGIDKLKNHVDTMLVISNSRIFEIVEKNTSVKDAFKKIDDVLKQAVQGIAGIISETAIINVDFNDVKTVLSNRGEAIMGIGQAKGDGRALKAASEALANPLIENNTFRQSGAMVAKIIGGNDFDMKEFHEAAEAISKFCRPDAEIIMGLDFDENLKDQVRIIIVATDLVREIQDPKPIEKAPAFNTLEDLHSMHALEQSPQEFAQSQDYIDREEDWGLRSAPPTKNQVARDFSRSGLGERRSIDFSVRKEDPQIYDSFDSSETRRSVGGVPPMASDLDTPAFLRRRKRIQSDSNY